MFSIVPAVAFHRTGMISASREGLPTAVSLWAPIWRHGARVRGGLTACWWRKVAVDLATAVIGSAFAVGLLASPAAAGQAGQLDAAFGRSGMVQQQFGPGVSTFGLTSAMQGNKIVVGGHFEGESRERFGVMRFNRDGRLDTSFANRGKAQFVIPSLSPRGSGIGVQPDGRIIQAGFAFSDAIEARLVVIRYGPTGALTRPSGATVLR